MAKGFIGMSEVSLRSSKRPFDWAWKKTLRSRSSKGVRRGIAVVAVFGAAAACAETSVYNDAIWWFRGGRDADGDGIAQAGELFDGLHADDTAHTNHTASFTGYEEARKWTTESVQFPSSRDDLKSAPVLNLPLVKKIPGDGSVTNLFMPYAKPFFLMGQITNFYTVVARVRRDWGCATNSTQWLFRFGYAGSARGGLLYGCTGDDVSTNKFPVMYYPKENTNGTTVALQEWRATGVTLPPPGVWYDLSVVVSGNTIRVGIARPATLKTLNAVQFVSNPSDANAHAPYMSTPSTSPDAWRLFAESGDAAEKNYTNAYRSAFSGAVQQFAVWNRALCDDEIREAWGFPNAALLKVGLENDGSNEFGSSAAPAAQTIDPYGPWHAYSPNLPAAGVWTVPFTGTVSEAGLPQLLRLKCSSSSAAGQMRVSVNGTDAETRTVTPGRRTDWFVPGAAFKRGTNTLTLTRTDGGTSPVTVDAFELGGSWKVGIDGQEWYDLASEGRVDFGVSTRDVARKHWPQAANLNAWTSNRTINVYVPEEVAARYPLTFGLRCNLWERPPEEYPYMNIFVNGTRRDVTVDGVTTNCIGINTAQKLYEVPFAPGELQAGWNTITLAARPKTATGKGYYLFDSFRFSVVADQPGGLLITVR